LVKAGDHWNATAQRNKSQPDTLSHHFPLVMTISGAVETPTIAAAGNTAIPLYTLNIVGPNPVWFHAAAFPALV
jgi:hypothetical protein